VVEHPSWHHTTICDSLSVHLRLIQQVMQVEMA